MPKRLAMTAADYARLKVVRKQDAGGGATAPGGSSSSSGSSSAAGGGSTVAGNPVMSSGTNSPPSPTGTPTPLSTTHDDGTTTRSSAGGGGGGGGGFVMMPAVFVGRSGINSLMNGPPGHTVPMEAKAKKRRRKPRLGIGAGDIAPRATEPVEHPGTRTKALGAAAPMVPSTTAPAPTGLDATGQPAAEDTELAVGFRLPADMALALALRDAIPPQSLFLELCEIGEGGDWDAETAARVQTLVEMLAADEAPMMVTISGVGRMMANEETGGKDLIYATVDSPDLDEFREDLMDALEEGGVLPTEEHSFIPMIPLAYIDANSAPPALVNIATKTFPLAAVSVQLGAAFVDYPLTGEQEEFDSANPAGLAGNAGNMSDVVAATRALPLLANKSAPPKAVSLRKAVWCPIVKTDQERRLVSGIVLQPEIVDAQGDIVSEAVIEAAAHQFLADYNAGSTLGHMHKNFDRKLDLVESYIAPVDLPINGSMVKKGTWLITARVVDDATWGQVKKGEILGFSIGGVAKARPLTDQI